MPILIDNNGMNNVVQISADLLGKGNGRIILDGDNNSIIVEPSALAFGGFFHLNGGARVSVGGEFNASQIFIYAVSGAVLRIGRQTGCNGNVRLLMHEAAQMTIGDGCLLASDVDVTISDMHSIIDVATRQRINPARDIIIGDRVWIGQRCMILKGANIGDGSVIGASSLVSKTIPPNCLAAGSPARVLRSNVTWDQRLL